MVEAPEVTVSDPSSGLPAFLARFDLLEFNSLPVSHFYRFGPSYGNFLHFFVPVEGLPLLEGLFKIHGDFTSGFRGGVFLGNILIELLCVVLISLRDSSLDSLSEEKLLEWKGVVQDLIEAKFNLSFLLEHLCSLAHMLFQRQASRNLDAEIVAVEKALVCAYKVLQDLKVKRRQVLSSPTVPTISPDSSLLADIIPQPFFQLVQMYFYFFRQFGLYKFYLFLLNTISSFPPPIFCCINLYFFKIASNFQQRVDLFSFFFSFFWH